jgi:hypothetical protein
MRVWGKRDSAMTEEEKRKWDDSMRVWGKRGTLTDEEKRTWGKGMRVWGKRGGDDNVSLLDEENAIDSQNNHFGTGRVDKKAWDKNMRVWGKRSKRSISDFDLDHEDVKRDWDNSAMRVWGKRRNPASAKGPKRSWKTNVMRVWGKRSSPMYQGDDTTNYDDDDVKRSWETNSMRTWGKRAWNTNSMRTWGKRSTPLRLQNPDEESLLNILNRLYH